MPDTAAPRRRHSWSDAYRTATETIRCCVECGLEKVTRHEPAQRAWTEFREEGRKIAGTATPPCPGRPEHA